MNIKLIYISKNKSNNIEFLKKIMKKINHFISYSSIGLKIKQNLKINSKIESNLILKI